MLNLIYYDLRATLKRMWLYIILMAIFSFVVRFIWSGIFTQNLNNDINNFYIPTIINFVALGALGIIAFILSIAVIVTQAKWFDESLLSPQGQFTNMLPVTSLQIMMSKVLTALFWSIIMVLMALGVMSIFLVNTDRYDQLMSTIIEIGASNNINISIAQIIFFTALFFVTAVTLALTICFVSQLIGHIFNSGRNLITLLSFLGLLVVSFVVLNIFTSILGVTIANLSSDIDSIIEFAISSAAKLSIINIIISLLYTFFGSYLLNHHLNLI